MVTMKKVFSSHIDEIGHDPATDELHVHYSDGNKAIYNGVPASTAKTVMGSASIGKALHTHVKGKFGHSYK